MEQLQIEFGGPCFIMWMSGSLGEDIYSESNLVPDRKSYMNIGLATADEDCFLEPTLQSIATAHGKTVGQVLSASSAMSIHSYRQRLLSPLNMQLRTGSITFSSAAWMLSSAKESATWTAWCAVFGPPEYVVVLDTSRYHQWLTQTCALQRSNDRLKENLDILGFELSAEEFRSTQVKELN